MATFFVDESIFQYHGKLFCHMWTDGSREDLHAFAAKVEVKRCWFESERKKGWDHYDLNQAQRARAVEAGALEQDRYAALEFVLKKRGVWTTEHDVKWSNLRLQAANQGNADAGRSDTPILSGTFQERST